MAEFVKRALNFFNRWQYYLHFGDNIFESRANIFVSSTDLSLSHRVEYLSRAILCVKSGETGVGGRVAGELLHHLEEKMEVKLL